MIRITNLSKTYQSKRRVKKALDNINLTLPSVGIVGLVGESGAGKTTFIDILSGNIVDYEGEIYIDEVCYSKLSNAHLRQKVAYLKQNEKLIPYLTVKENIEYFYQIDDLEKLLDHYHIDVTLDKYPTEISGGEQQRIAILQAVLEKKKILLLDEPTSSLDDANAEAIMNLIKVISKDVLVILVSHDEKIVSKYCKQVFEIQNGMIIDSYEIDNYTKENQFVPQTHNKNLNKVLLKSSINYVNKHYILFSSFFVVHLLLLFVFSIVASFISYNGIDDIMATIDNTSYLITYYDEKYGSFYGNDFIYDELSKKIGANNVHKVDNIPFFNKKDERILITCYLDENLNKNEIKTSLNVLSELKTNLDNDVYYIETINDINGDISNVKKVVDIIDEDIIYVSYEDYYSDNLSHFKINYYYNDMIKKLTIYNDAYLNMIKNNPIFYSNNNNLQYDNIPNNLKNIIKGNITDLSKIYPNGLTIEKKSFDDTFNEESLILSSEEFKNVLKNTNRYFGLALDVKNKKLIADIYKNNNYFFNISYTSNKDINYYNTNICNKLNHYLEEGNLIKDYYYLSYIVMIIFIFIQDIILFIQLGKISFIRREEDNRLSRFGISKGKIIFSKLILQIILVLIMYGLSLLLMYLFRGPLSKQFNGTQEFYYSISFFNDFILQNTLVVVFMICSILLYFIFVRRKEV